MSGFVKIHRKIRENPLFSKNHAARHLFKDMLEDAAWADTVQDWRGKPVNVARGQLMISTRQMAERYGFSHRQVRTIIDTLKSHEIIKVDTVGGTGPMLITVCNYAKYQDVRHSGDTLGDTAATQRRHTKEEEEELKKKENTIPRVRETVDLKTMSERLFEAGGDALNRTLGSLESMADVLNWIDAGADLERDILPTIQELCRKAKAKGSTITVWHYFAGAVAQRQQRRESYQKDAATPQTSTLKLDVYDRMVPTNVEPVDDVWAAEMREARHAH